MQILKKEVDSYEMGKRIPVCQLQAIAISTIDHLSNLLYSVKLEGTKDHYSYIQLFRATAGIYRLVEGKETELKLIIITTT